MRNVIYLTGDDPKTVRLYKEELYSDFLLTNQGEPRARKKLEKNGVYTRRSHHILPCLATKPKSEYNKEKSEDVYKVTIEDDGEATIIKLT